LFSIAEIVDIAVQIEKNGEATYRNAVQKISDPSLVRLLEWMADEEANHIQWLLDLKQKVDSDTENSFAQNMPRHLLNDTIGNQRFSLAEIDFSQIDNISDLIDIFIEFERDSILFYEMLKPFVLAADARSLLDQIIAEETLHIEKLEEVMANTS
jgi:rubrerythrin